MSSTVSATASEPVYDDEGETPHDAEEDDGRGQTRLISGFAPLSTGDSLEEGGRASRSSTSSDFATKVKQLVQLGYTKEDADHALTQSGGDVPRAVQFLTTGSVL